MRDNPRIRVQGLLIGLGAILLGGCVERTIRIGSDPEGAVVFLNDVEVGRTPVVVPFTWYGDYDVVLRMEKNVGTTTQPDFRRYYLHTSKRAAAPWYQWLGVDFFSEILPVEVKDEQLWTFLVPEVKAVPDDELLEHAKALKGEMDKPGGLPATK